MAPEASQKTMLIHQLVTKQAPKIRSQKRSSQKRPNQRLQRIC